MIKIEVLRELNKVLDKNTVAFFSVTLTQTRDGSLLPTITSFELDKANYETRLRLVDAIINVAQTMRERE